jgi:hypothetical protein
LTEEVIQQMREMAGNLRSNIGEEAWMKKVLRTLPGESTTHTAATPAGDYFTSTATVDQNRNIRIVVSSARANETMVDAQLNWTGAGWSAPAGSNQSAVIPVSISLDSLAVAALATGIVNSNISNKIGNRPTNSDPCATELNNYQAPDAGTYCIPHDLVCTSPLGSNLLPIFTSDQTHIKFWAPCIGTYRVDIGDCCFNHDIACWCAQGIGDVAAANLYVTSCVVGHIITQAWTTLWNELKQKGWFERYFDLIFCGALIAAWEALLLGGSIAGIPIFAALFGLFNVGYDYFLYEWLKANPCFADFDGRHADSCLCGGSKPTSQCEGFGAYGSCTDICKLAKKSVGIEQCYNCGFICKYTNGVASKVFDAGSDRNSNPNGWPCCPGTSQACTTSQGLPCPPCAVCAWGCDCDKQTHKWFQNFDMWIDKTNQVVDKSSGIPCCNGEDPYHPKPPKYWLDCQANNGILPC